MIANKCGVVNHKYENVYALCYQGEVHDCGVAAYIQQVLLDWNGSPWLSFTAAGPTLGAWERVQLGFALCIRDRPGEGSRLNICVAIDIMNMVIRVFVRDPTVLHILSHA